MTPADACRDVLDALDEKPGSGDLWAAVDAHRAVLERIANGQLVCNPPADPPNDSGACCGMWDDIARMCPNCPRQEPNQ